MRRSAGGLMNYREAKSDCIYSTDKGCLQEEALSAVIFFQPLKRRGERFLFCLETLLF